MPKHLTESVNGNITATHEFTTGTCKVSDAASFKANVVSEYTAGSGVTVDSVLLKDDGVGATYVLHPTAGTTMIKVCTDLATDVAAGVTNLAVFETLTTGTTVTLSSSQYLYFFGDGKITVSSGTTLTIPSPSQVVAAKAQQVFTINGTLKFTSGGLASGMWGGAKSDGSTADATLIQKMADAMTGGGTLYFPKGSSYYPIATAIDIDTADNVTIEGENGAELRMTASGVNGLNITKNNVRIRHLTMQGQGTYVCDNSTSYGLIKSTGDHTEIEKCYLKEGESWGVRIEGDYSRVHDNTFEGGPFFDTGASPIGSNRQYYGALYMEGADYGDFSKNIVKPNSNASAGKPIECICTQLTKGMSIDNNKFLGSWDHSVYTVMHGGSVCDNTIQNAGAIKVLMPSTAYYETAVRGNTICNNVIDGGDRQSEVLSGDGGIILNNPCFSTICNNGITRVSDAGISITLSTSPFYITDNVISNNVVYSVKPGGGTDALGFSVDNTGCSMLVFARNQITNNVFSYIGDTGAGTDAGIYIALDDRTTHVDNVICNNTIESFEFAVVAYYLTESSISNNIIQLSRNGGDAAIYGFDLQNCDIMFNRLRCSTSTNYLYREESSGDYNTIIGNECYGIQTSVVRTTTLGSNSIVRGNYIDGEPDLKLYNDFLDIDTAAGVTITAAYMKKKFIRRDPSGAIFTDTLDSANNIISDLLKNQGDFTTLYYFNYSSTATTITLASGAGTTILTDEGASDLILEAGEGVTLTVVRTGSNLVRVFTTVHTNP